MPKKKRKPRGIKLNGQRSQDMCPYCLTFNCDSLGISSKLAAKFDKRRAEGKCPSCGNNPCKCKSG